MVHKVIVQVVRQTKFSHNRELLLRVIIEKCPGKYCFPLSILISSIKSQVKKL